MFRRLLPLLGIALLLLFLPPVDGQNLDWLLNTGFYGDPLGIGLGQQSPEAPVTQQQAGNDPFGEQNFGNQPVVQDLSGSQPALQDPWGGQPALQDPSGSQPALQDPWGGLPALQDPSGSQSALQDPWGSQSALQDPWGSQAALQDPWGSQSGLQDPWGNQAGVPDPWGNQFGAQDIWGNQIGAQDPWGNPIAAQDSFGNHAGAQDPWGNQAATLDVWGNHDPWGAEIGAQDPWGQTQSQGTHQQQTANAQARQPTRNHAVDGHPREVRLTGRPGEVVELSAKRGQDIQLVAQPGVRMELVGQNGQTTRVNANAGQPNHTTLQTRVNRSRLVAQARHNQAHLQSTRIFPQPVQSIGIDPHHVQSTGQSQQHPQKATTSPQGQQQINGQSRQQSNTETQAQAKGNGQINPQRIPTDRQSSPNVRDTLSNLQILEGTGRSPQTSQGTTQSPQNGQISVQLVTANGAQLPKSVQATVKTNKKRPLSVAVTGQHPQRVHVIMQSRQHKPRRGQRGGLTGQTGRDVPGDKTYGQQGVYEGGKTSRFVTQPGQSTNAGLPIRQSPPRVQGGGQSSQPVQAGEQASQHVQEARPGSQRAHGIGQSSQRVPGTGQGLQGPQHAMGDVLSSQLVQDRKQSSQGTSTLSGSQRTGNVAQHQQSTGNGSKHVQHTINGSQFVELAGNGSKRIQYSRRVQVTAPGRQYIQGVGQGVQNQYTTPTTQRAPQGYQPGQRMQSPEQTTPRAQSPEQTTPLAQSPEQSTQRVQSPEQTTQSLHHTMYSPKPLLKPKDGTQRTYGPNSRGVKQNTLVVHTYNVPDPAAHGEGIHVVVPRIQEIEPGFGVGLAAENEQEVAPHPHSRQLSVQSHGGHPQANPDSMRHKAAMIESRVRTGLDTAFISESSHGPSSRTEVLGAHFVTDPAARRIVEAGAVMIEASRTVAREMSVNQQKDAVTLRDMQGLSNHLPCPFRTKIQCDSTSKYRTMDGSCNNLENPYWGKANTPFERFLPPSYDDGVDSPRSTSRSGGALPLPRVISTEVHKQSSAANQHPYISHMTMEFGQFVSYDISRNSLSTGNNGTALSCCTPDGKVDSNPFKKTLGCLPIELPANDPFFSQFNRTCMNFVRAAPSPDINCELGFRQQLNQVSNFIDASTVYGSDVNTSKIIRLGTGGMLKVTASVHGDLLLQDPSAHGTSFCATSGSLHCFKGGDIRANQQPALLALHTIFLREHNRIAKKLGQLNHLWGDEKVFQETRKIVGAEIQHITYSHYLPTILGDAIASRFGFAPQPAGEYYSGYDVTLNPTIRNAFAAAANRFGHSTVRDHFASGLLFKDHFFNPRVFYDVSKGPAFVARNLANENEQSTDNLMSTQLTDRLFETVPGAGLDLAATNIKRGRDHGLPGYNSWRQWCGYQVADNFTGLADHKPEAAGLLGTVYNHPDDIDLWTGIVTETPLEGRAVGPTGACLIGRQFWVLKHADRFYYENNDAAAQFTIEQLNEIRKTTLSKIVCENSYIPAVQVDLFREVSNPGNPIVHCLNLQSMDLSAWKECHQGNWQSWSGYTPCSAGFRTRTRQCMNLSPNPCKQPCKGAPFELDICGRNSEFLLRMPPVESIRPPVIRRRQRTSRNRQ